MSINTRKVLNTINLQRNANQTTMTNSHSLRWLKLKIRIGQNGKKQSCRTLLVGKQTDAAALSKSVW